MSRIMSFRMQRVVFTFLIFIIGFAFTTAVLWGHLDKVIKGPYGMLAKAGLILLPAVSLIMSIWELFVDQVGAEAREHKLHPTVSRLINWCFFGSLALFSFEVIHAGALLKYESSTAEQESKIAAIGDAQAKIAGATTSAAIESSGRVARDLNASGQHKTARNAISSGKETAAAASEGAQKELVKAAQGIKPDTFLPQWYIDGGMYAALPLLAIFFFAVTMFLARQASPFVDADDDGRADAKQHRANNRSAAQKRQPEPDEDEEGEDFPTEIEAKK